jgi:hypothetical protein
MYKSPTSRSGRNLAEKVDLFECEKIKIIEDLKELLSSGMNSEKPKRYLYGIQKGVQSSFGNPAIGTRSMELRQ